MYDEVQQRNAKLEGQVHLLTRDQEAVFGTISADKPLDSKQVHTN